MGCGAVAGHPVEMRFSVVFIFLRFVLKERDCSLHLRPERAGPLLTKRTRLCPRRRAAEPQQPSDSRRKLENFLRLLARGCGGATRGTGAGGMNMTETSSADAC